MTYESICELRNKVKIETLDYLSPYVGSFIGFIKNSPPILSPAYEKTYEHLNLAGYFSTLARTCGLPWYTNEDNPIIKLACETVSEFITKEIGFRTEFRIIDANEIVIRAYLTKPFDITDPDESIFNDE